MKLVEIKNSLAKLYYEPADFPLVLSDFLTVDDGNQKILSQVVSIESTNRDTTNCAILKFSLNLNADNTHDVYSGYVPPLDALVSKTPPKILASIFNDKEKGIKLGKLTSTANINLNINPEIIDNFLYIQSDTQEEINSILNKIVNFNNEYNKKTVVLDFDGLITYNKTSNIELGKDFKLPIDKNTINYIYENDLTGLTVEQKAIVQDILLDVQDYIDTIDEGYIPFSTLLNVVNEIYEAEKSTGIILLRNKLLKYNQLNIFASSNDEINALKDSVKNNTVTILDLKNTVTNWQKESVVFLINNIKENYHLLFNVKDNIFDTNIINKIYKSENIKPIIASAYNSDFSAQLKSFAKNLILFKPQNQQKAFATYSSFINKISNGEFIISGADTYYTPLIIKEIPHKIEQIQSDVSQNSQIKISDTDNNNKEIIKNLEVKSEEPTSYEEEAELISPEKISLLPLEADMMEEIQPINEHESQEAQSEIKNIFDESLEQEIAKDVDKMFYAEAAITAKNTQNTTNILPEENKKDTAFDTTVNYEELFSDEDLDMLDNIEEESEENIIDDNEDIIQLDDISNSDSEDILSDTLDDTSNLSNINYETNTSLDETIEFQTEKVNSIEQSFTETESLLNIPVYKTEIDEKIETNNSIKIAEGNIVYHEKYGRGVVEQLIKYGNKTLCSIQFDNVGRRLLDPNLADLKQM